MNDARRQEGSSADADTAMRTPRVVLPQPATVTNPPLPWRRIILSALIPWALTRLAYVALTALASHFPQTRPAQGAGFFGVWQRFDTNWYISIATQGYHQPQQIAFFPVYPALIHLFGALTGGNALLAALVVSNLSAITALIAIGALAAWELRDAEAARWAMLALLIYPFSFFLTTAYTEGLFLTFTAFCLLFARQGRWRSAALMALLAAATRPTGVALIAPLAWEWLRQQGLVPTALWSRLRDPDRLQVIRGWVGALAQSARQQWTGLLAVGAAPAFLLGLAVYCGIRFKHPSLIIFVRRDYWGLESAPIWRTIPREVAHMLGAPVGSDPQIIMLLDLIALAIATGAVIALVRSAPFAYTLYMVGLLYLCVAQPAVVGVQVLQGPARYLLASVPLFISLGTLLERHPRLRIALICVGAILQCYIAVRFLTGVLIE